MKAYLLESLESAKTGVTILAFWLLFFVGLIVGLFLLLIIVRLIGLIL